MSELHSQHLTLIDTHITAILIGIVMCEILSFASFDLRLIAALIRKRSFRPVPAAYLTARFTTLVGMSILAAFTLSFAAQKPQSELALHWVRALVLPINFASTSAVLGYRALVLHFNRRRTVSCVIHLLLLVELAGGTGFMTLAVTDPHNPAKEFSYGSGRVSLAWTTASVAVALIIDAILSLQIVVPILRGGELPRKGEVTHLLLCDSISFGAFSVVAKAVAIGYTLGVGEKDANPYLPIRIEGVASTILACRIFRAQETSLQRLRDEKASPSLGAIALEECRMAVSKEVGRVNVVQEAAQQDRDSIEAICS
uniref:Uncharacterized protein n=1 Tax=Kalmanozyma brasiliensis (strain GHG001) TaxID=1365824 RepID=V5EUD3_KALBG